MKKKKAIIEPKEVQHLAGKVRHLGRGLKGVKATSQLLTGPMDLEQVLELVVKTIAQVVGADAAGLRLLNEDTGKLELKATYGLSDEYIHKGPVTAGESELYQRTLNGEPTVVEDMRSSVYFRQYHDDVVREGLISCMSIGLVYRDKGIGILRLYNKRSRRFSEEDITLAQTVAGQSAAAITNARLYQEALEGERVSRQVRLAGLVQQHLIPQKPLLMEGVWIHGVYVPCYEVGGDFYDYIRLGDDRLGVAMGDVMGKGVPASLAMASLRSSLRAYAEHTDDVGHVMSQVNRMFCRDTDVGQFATVFFGVLEISTGRFTYCNCGHERPVWIRGSEKRVLPLNEGGTILGIDKSSLYETAQAKLEPGDMLVLYTDGLAEAMNFQRENFGRERIIQAVLDSAELTAEQAAKNILWVMRKFTGLTRRFDDTALVVLKKL